MGNEYLHKRRILTNHFVSILIALVAVCFTLGAPTPASAGASDAVVATSVLIAADDFVINVYHNGQPVSDSQFKLEGDIFGATVMRVQMDVRSGDWIVFEVANDRFRWNGSCGFAAAGLAPGGKVAFVSDTEGGHWSACDSSDKASHFISDADYLSDAGAAVPANPWMRANDEMKSRCRWNGKIIWGASDARHVWIKYGGAAGAGNTSGDDDNTAKTENVTSNLKKGEGPVTHLAKTQQSIKALYVMEQDSGGMLGIASDLILTATPGEAEGDTIPVSFGTPVGSEMHMVLDDVLRSINHKYQHLDASQFEFTFEDKYTGHDGGSIGAAIGTLILSLIEGFDIDPQLAITGDISADGKVHAIGGVTAKLRGAKAAGCTLVAIPKENFEQLADTLVYSGVQSISDPQVIGISSLDEASATARVDRDSNLKQAIDLFAEVQQGLQASPTYLQGTEAQAKLQHVLELAPQDFSAKLLLEVAQNKQRRRLTAGASEYYAFVALNSVLPALDEEKLVGPAQVMPAAMSQGLAALRKLRPIADLRIQPLIDACSELIKARSDFDLGNGSADLLKEKYRAFVEELSKLQADTTLMEKMLHEGV
jgi:hypothetical protein